MAGVPEDELKQGLRAAFGAAGEEHSVLARLEHDGRSVPRVLLRDLEYEASPLLKPKGGREGRYQVVGEIARGGVGVVLKGRDVDLGRDVAMKVLRDEHRDNREILQRFVEEAQIGGQLQHPGIVPVYEMGISDKQKPYFTMKLVKGKTLAAELRARRSPDERLRRFLSIFERVCETMAYAHSRDVVHRDLKPANIIIGAYSEVQVVDWGFAKVLGREEPEHVERTIIETVRSGSESMAGSVLGTPAYMPPEQALGQVESLDKSSDVFGLGAILCEILTGAPPYVGKNAGAIMMQASTRAFDESRLDGHALGPLTKRCLAAKQSERPADAGELAKAIQDHLAAVEERTKAAQVTAAEEQAHADQARHARKLTLGIAAALLVAVGVGAGFWIHGQRQERERSERIAKQTRPLLERANLLRGQGAWGESLALAKRARDLGGEDLVAAIEADQHQAEAEARQARSDRLLLARIEEARLAHADYFDVAPIEAMYAAAVAEYERGAIDDLVSRVRSRPPAFAVQVSFVLDDWARLRRESERPHAEWAPLVRAAQSLDSHAWRNDLREATIAEDRARRLALAEAVEAQDWRSLLMAGRTISWLGADAVAAPILRRAWRLAPDDLWVNYHLASSLPSTEAIAHRRAAVALRPESPQLKLRLGHTLNNSGRSAEALAAFERCRPALEDSVELWTRIAWARLKLDDREGALTAFERAKRLPLESQSPVALNNFAWALVLKPTSVLFDPKAGLVAIQHAIAKDKSRGALWNTLAFAQYRNGDYRGAIASAERSLSLSPGNHMYDEYLLAMAHHRLGNDAEARAAFRKASDAHAKRNFGGIELPVIRAEAMKTLGIDK